MVAVRRLFIVVVTLAVSVGYAVGPCCASIMVSSPQISSVSDNTPVSPTEQTIWEFLRGDQSTDDSSMSVTSTATGNPVVACNLIEERLADNKLSASDKTYLSSWIWLPSPSISDLLRPPQA